MISKCIEIKPIPLYALTTGRNVLKGAEMSSIKYPPDSDFVSFSNHFFDGNLHIGKGFGKVVKRSTPPRLLLLIPLRYCCLYIVCIARGKPCLHNGLILFD
jgi:hypothetical protein